MTVHKRSTAGTLLALVSLVALTMTFMVSSVSADDTVWATPTGYAEASEANNHAETWGENCDDIGVGGVDSYLLPALGEDEIYELVVVKAGSEASDGNNTLFADASAGETVWADTNENGIADIGGQGGDKQISHIIVCIGEDEGPGEEELTPTLSLEKVVTAGDANLGFSFTLGGAALDSAVKASDPAKLLASAAGSYTIVEVARAGWNVSAIACTGNAAAASANVATRTVTVTVGADEDVVCTFTNSPEGTQSGNPPTPPSTPPSTAPSAGGVKAGVPNTAMDLADGGAMPFLLALAAIAGLAILGRQNIKEMMDRR